MAGTDPNKQFLSLIRDFATEKSKGVQRVVNLKKRIEEVQSELESATVELEKAKNTKETTEQELKGYEVELALYKASTQALEARISLIQDEISSAGSDLEGLKSKEGASRDIFICKMFELNRKIRNFQKTYESGLGASSAGSPLIKPIPSICKEPPFEIPEGKIMEVTTKIMEWNHAHLTFQTTQEEEAHRAEQNIKLQEMEELIIPEKKVALIEMIIKSTKELKELTEQISEMEKTYTLLSEELQRRCLCPNCHLDNIEAMYGILQENEVTLCFVSTILKLH